MRINKQKLIEALKILKLTPSKTISILNSESRHLCYTDVWRNSPHGKYNVKFSTDPHAHQNETPELSIPSCVILSKEEIKRAKSMAYASKYQQSALLSEFLFDNKNQKLKLIKVLNSIET